MIFFDGISINSVAKVDIDDIYVSPIQYDFIARARAIRGGSDFVRSRAGTRTVTITFALLDMNMVNRQKSLLAISEWAKDDKEYKLELPGHPEHYLVATCTSKPNTSLRQWWEGSLRLVFTCFDNPYWNAKAEKSVACGSTAFIFGDAPPLMRIERTLAAAAQDQTYSNGAQSMTFSQIPAGDMVIDLNAQTARVGNTSIMQYYQPSGSFIIPKPGTQTITGTGTVKYRERWD